MTTNHHLAPLLALFAIASTIGCGTREYEQRYNEQIEDLWRLEPFLDLQEKATSIPLADDGQEDTGAALLRLPNVFDKNAKRYESGMSEGEAVDPLRKLPPFMRSLPHFRFSYERFLGKPGKPQWPIHIYVCADERRGSPFEAHVNKEIQRAYEGFSSAELKKLWQQVECDAPDESTIEWNQLSLRLGEQSFTQKSNNNFEQKDTDGVVEVFVHSDLERGRHVMFMLRMPTELEQDIDLAQLARSVAGTLRWSDAKKGE